MAVCGSVTAHALSTLGNPDLEQAQNLPQLYLHNKARTKIFYFQTGNTCLSFQLYDVKFYINFVKKKSFFKQIKKYKKTKCSKIIYFYVVYILIYCQLSTKNEYYFCFCYVINPRKNGEVIYHLSKNITFTRC